MREAKIEKWLVEAVKKKGAICYKFNSSGCSGVPDRVIIWQTGEVHFVELKNEKGTLSKLQEHQISRLRSQKANVFVLKGLEEVKKYVEIQTTRIPEAGD